MWNNYVCYLFYIVIMLIKRFMWSFISSGLQDKCTNGVTSAPNSQVRPVVSESIPQNLVLFGFHISVLYKTHTHNCTREFVFYNVSIRVRNIYTIGNNIL